MPKILIVEDNEDNWQILSRRLRRRGYDVVIARDGKQGLTMAKSDKPDLILMDMNLPLLDGWEATRLIKGTRSGKQTPSSPSPPTRSPETATRHSKRGATTTTPSRWSCRDCWSRSRNSCASARPRWPPPPGPGRLRTTAPRQRTPAPLP